jgi:hypothetical protein
MPYIELQDLLRGFSQLTPEQAIFINWFYSRFDSRAAANRRIVNVEPLYYIGGIGATEFLVYAATKLYLCLELLTCGITPVQIAIPETYLYDENNVLFIPLQNNSTFWNVTGAAINYSMNDIFVKNVYFSRLLTDTQNLRFIGYRITLV